MPTYEYECMECKNKFDVFQSMNDTPVEKCVTCGGKVRKLFGTAGLIFKGKGFYVNDYKNKSASSASTDAPSGAPQCAGCSSAGSCPAASE